MITGFYTPEIDMISINASGVFIIEPDRPICLALADITGDGATRTVTIEIGTWDGVTFTSEQTVGHVSANSGDSNQIAVLSMLNKDKAAKITVA